MGMGRIVVLIITMLAIIVAIWGRVAIRICWILCLAIRKRIRYKLWGCLKCFWLSFLPKSVMSRLRPVIMRLTESMIAILSPVLLGSGRKTARNRMVTNCSNTTYKEDSHHFTYPKKQKEFPYNSTNTSQNLPQFRLNQGNRQQCQQQIQ